MSKAIQSCTTPPAAPTGLSATPGNSKVTLQWNASAAAPAYIVKRGTSSGSETFLNWTTQTTYTDNTAVNGTKYDYVVTAVNVSTSQSGPSNEASATPQ